jgi:hypothetical protein
MKIPPVGQPVEHAKIAVAIAEKQERPEEQMVATPPAFFAGMAGALAPLRFCRPACVHPCP